MEEDNYIHENEDMTGHGRVMSLAEVDADAGQVCCELYYCLFVVFLVSEELPLLFGCGQPRMTSSSAARPHTRPTAAGQAGR